MTKEDKIIKIVTGLLSNQRNVSFTDLLKVCDFILATRVNIHNKGGKAKPYQMRQVLNAIDGIVNLAANVVEDMTGNDEVIPTPLSERKYSGKFQVRITEDEHRRLAVRAAEQKISLNKLAASKLAECC